MEDQKTSKKSIKKTNTRPKASPSTNKKGNHLLNPSYIKTQDEVDSILSLFGIIGIEAIPVGPTGSIYNPSEEYFVFTSIHIWHTGYLSFLGFLLRYLKRLNIAPIQFAPNTHLTNMCISPCSGNCTSFFECRNPPFYNWSCKN